MAPPRGKKRKPTTEPEILDVTGSQTPTSSPAPARAGRARSPSSLASAKDKAKAPASSPALSAGRGSGEGGWSAKDDGLDDFAFDMMSDSDGGDGDEGKDALVSAAYPKSKPPPRKKRAVASVMRKKGPKAASSPGGTGTSGSAGGGGSGGGTNGARVTDGTPAAQRKPGAPPSSRRGNASMTTKTTTAEKRSAASAAAASSASGDSGSPVPGDGAERVEKVPKSAAAKGKAKSKAKADPKATSSAASQEEVIDVRDEGDEKGENGSNDSDNDGDGGGGNSDNSDGPGRKQGFGSTAAKKSAGGGEGSRRGSVGGTKKSGTEGKGTKQPASAAAAPASAPASARKKRASPRPSPSVGGIAGGDDGVGEKGKAEAGAAAARASSKGAPRTDSDEDALPPNDEDNSGGGRVLTVGGKGSDVDLTEEDDDDSPAEAAAEAKSSSSKKQKNKSTAGGTMAAAAAAPSGVGDGKQAGGGRGKGKGKAKAGVGSAAMSSAKPAKLAEDVEVVLRRLRKLRGEMARGGGGGGSSGGGGDGGGKKPPTLLELGLSGDVTEVQEMGAAGVMDEIERIAVETALSIMEGKGFGFRVPTRSSGNQKYVEELDRIVLGDKVSFRNFVSTAMARKTAITTRVIQLVHQVLGKGIHITKRDMFYTDVKLFKDQSESDHVLDDVACMIGCTRSCLNVVASDKGLVVGRVTFMEDGDLIDCTRMGVGGKAIPPYIDKITDIRSDADFILLVEKEAAYMRMAEDRFYQKYPCIVITAKGQPDVATRLFLKRLKRELNIPVMGLVDSDPYGLKILSVYMSGSKNMSYDSASLTTPDIKWLGVRPSDLDRYNIPEQCRLDMTEHDIKTGKELLQEDFIKKNEPWCRELELMIKSKKKAEIQSLSAFGFQYLTHTYLPQKLQNGDWV